MIGDFRVAIPARYGSSRLPGKPLLSLGDRCVLQHVYERAAASGAGEVVIATDDQRIRSVAEGFGASVCMTRSDHASGTERLAEASRLLDWPEDAVVVNLQGDEPLTPPALLRQVAQALMAQPEASMASLCTPITEAGEMHDPHVVKVVRDAQDFALYFSRAPIPWERDALGMETDPSHGQCFRHLGIYGYRVGYLRSLATAAPSPLEQAERLEQLRALWHGARIHVPTAIERPGPGIDTADDLTAVRARLG